MWPIFACTTVDLEKFCHGTPLTEINNVVDDGPFFSLTYGAADADTLGLKLHWFDFLSICCKRACTNTSTTTSTKWSLGLTVYICANNRQVVCVTMCFKYRCCLVISLGMQCGIGDFAWGIVAQSIAVIADILVFKIAAVCHLGFVGHILGPPTKSTWRSLWSIKIWLKSIH